MRFEALPFCRALIRFCSLVTKETRFRPSCLFPLHEKSGAVDPQSGKDTKKSIVLRRLLIGNDEYVRIGNGNQLIRDPKKLIRFVAREKIRWSLHTARLRLARKQQYCQFFTRFGKCNKDNGKCPYIHDPTKVAVCMKFLKGLCKHYTNCNLTHKVIPERMQDCSYFLQGLCTNENCPYRHVNVNPGAPVCEGFLRGYCADGDKCHKKHSYVCPVFEATGICPQESMCKLHHPRNQHKGNRRRRSVDRKRKKGRDFGSRRTDVIGSSSVASNKQAIQNNEDIFFHEGRFVDYISFDVSDEEAGECD
ncbi:LOW QUALITY PROTEIN: zinc finger CCCH domain-containing protein 7-like [Telopea speciosissima]|uniref:LOW QUALITY PROTEIN: zinc finger CCCH domain-containing protein 7-like n=1 Tax=Telopea speciosissima TaxID=54955 RepID=UPI001CC7D635|nr:LOW QUALITY PROTEIN: zinc finger CCCH domain-containing protein 7-like [Telopea speciosissima]